MKSGARAIGIAESYGAPTPSGSAGVGQQPEARQSTVAAVVVKADRSVDGFGFDTWTVGGTDATDTAVSVVRGLDREDVRYLLVSGIAPAWFNVLDLSAVESAIGVPVISVSFEPSRGLGPALEREFSGDELGERLSTYERQPNRERVEVGDESVFVRAVGVGPAEAEDVVRAFTPSGGRPEPIRVARLAARAAHDRWAHS